MKIAINRNITLILVILGVFTLACTPTPDYTPVTDGADLPGTVNLEHPKKEAIQTVLDKYTQQGLPGLTVLVRTADGEIWMGASGFAQIEEGVLMQPMNRMFSASIGKTFCALAVISLAQNGTIDLDQPLATYLPNHLKGVQTAQTATVRQTLAHIGGFTNLDDNAKFISDVLNDPFSIRTTDLLNYEREKSSYASPGNRHHYSSTGYELLGELLQEVTGNQVTYYREQVFEPLGLSAFYHSEVNNGSIPDLVNSYWDRFDNEKIENVSALNLHLTSVFTGSDGVVATVYDYYLLLKELMEGGSGILNEVSRQALLSFSDTGFRNTTGYGLGLQRRNSDFGERYGHDGDAIGAGADMWYFPDHDVYVVAATNIGTVLEGRLSDLYNHDFLNELFRAAID